MGYLVKMSTATTLTIQGVPLNQTITIPNNPGWYLIGCPYQTVTPISNYFNINNCKQIKNFTGFWIPDGTKNSIINFEPGKGYFLRK